jgi:site-specific DNA-methyltransferase (adenine-specific)
VYRLPDVLEWRYAGNELHPTQKPVMAILPLVMAYSEQGDIVLDPFAGSGTTALASLELGRRYGSGNSSALLTEAIKIGA